MSLQKRLQRNLGRYLARPTAGRPKLKGAISQVISALPETVIFGGMIREFALGNARTFVSDIDLVSMAPQSDIACAVAQYGAVRNKFGGFRFVIDKQRFDIWSLADTWAFRSGVASGSDFRDLLKTCFFNLDAACYHVAQHKLLCAERYEDWVGERVLDINLLPNPSPMNMARRALVLMQTHQLGVTRRLAQYVVANLNQEALSWTEHMLIKRLIEFLSKEGPDEYRFSPQSELDAQ